MKSRSGLAAVLCAVFFLALSSVAATPADAPQPEARADKDLAGHAEFHEPPSFEGFEAEFLGGGNCTWTCLDGSTGESTVLTQEECNADCEDDCGGPCGPA